MRRFLRTALPVAAFALATVSSEGAEESQEPASGCLRCHDGIEPIRQPGSEMLEAIIEEGENLDDPAGCVVCHGGDRRAAGGARRRTLVLAAEKTPKDRRLSLPFVFRT